MCYEGVWFFRVMLRSEMVIWWPKILWGMGGIYYERYGIRVVWLYWCAKYSSAWHEFIHSIVYWSHYVYTKRLWAHHS
jgi:hypothetical protein